MIKDLKDKQTVNGFRALVKDSSFSTTQTGARYLSVILQDGSGSIEAKKWNAYEEDKYVFESGNLVEIEGEVNKFKGALQLKIISARLLDIESENLADFIPQSKYSSNELESEFNRLLETIKDSEYKKLLETIFNDYHEKIFFYPAAVRNHHNFERGLITHSISIAQIIEFLCKHYDNENLNYDLLITGALLHDLGKIIELNGPVLTKYTEEGKLLGHISIGHSLISYYCKKMKMTEEKRILLEHLILTHHGKLEYGSPILPLTKEALLLSMLDDLDAKMQLCDSTLLNVVEGEFSSPVFALDNRVLYKPKKK